jgi:hypothetical protein
MLHLVFTLTNLNFASEKSNELFAVEIGFFSNDDLNVLQKRKRATENSVNTCRKERTLETRFRRSYRVSGTLERRYISQHWGKKTRFLRGKERFFVEKT